MVFAKGKDAAISPLLPVERECRVILLKGQVRAVYEKTLTAHSDPWKHNLGQGAVPQMVKAGKGRQELENLAQQGAACAGLVFGAVDLVYAKERWQILEINGGVMMEYLARQSADWRFLAKTIYRDGILSMLKG